MLTRKRFVLLLALVAATLTAAGHAAQEKPAAPEQKAAGKEPKATLPPSTNPTQRVKA